MKGRRKGRKNEERKKRREEDKERKEGQIRLFYVSSVAINARE